MTVFNVSCAVSVGEPSTELPDLSADKGSKSYDAAETKIYCLQYSIHSSLLHWILKKIREKQKLEIYFKFGHI